jgi:hypothetical protein
MKSQFRRSELIVLWAWVVFVLAGLGFYGLLDDNPLSKMASVPALQLSVLAVQAGAVLTLLGVTAGGLPIGWAVVRFAVGQRRRDVLALLAVPVICALAMGGAGAALLVVANTTGAPNAVGISLFFGIAGLFPVAAIASAAAVSAAVMRSPVSETWYRLARVPSAGAVAAMALTLCAVAAWGISANLAAPQAFHGALGLLDLSTDLSWVGVLAGMGLATLVAAVTVGRSFADHSRGTRAHAPA